jgi:hypothetical protein
MDKLKKYQDLIIDFLQRYNAETSKGLLQGINRRLLIDRKNNSFQLISIGWRGDRHVFGVVFHFDILNEKIWIQCNGTEREIVDEFIAAGVPKNDIVLGFLPPDARHFLGFAVA